MVGDEDFVKQALKLGIKVGDFSASLGNTKELSDGKLHSIDIDISTEAGWNAYQRFVTTGKLPEPGSAATKEPTKAETVRYTDTTELEAKLGGLTLGGRGSSSEGRWISARTSRPARRPTRPTPATTTPSLTYSFEEDANGDPTGTPRYSLMLHDVHDSYIPMLYDRMGREAAAGRRPAEGPPDRLHRGGAPRAAGARARRGSASGCRWTAMSGRPTRRSAGRCRVTAAF